MTSSARPAGISRPGAGLIFIFSLALILIGCLSGPNSAAAPFPTSRAESSLASSEPSKVPAATYVVPEDSILFGQSAAFSGPAQELGRNMRLGIEAAFHEVNERGGVHGRELLLTHLDDAYEPEAAIANTQRLIEEEGGVFALIGAVGTPTSRSAVPVAAEAGVPYIAPFTGAAFLRDPGWNNIVNLRASYNQETEEAVARLTSDLRIRRIAIMYQDDSFGRAGYVGVRRALERRRMEPVSIGLYPRNTRAIKDRAPRPPPRGSGSRGLDRSVPTGCGACVLGPAYWSRPGVRNPLLRRQQRPREGAGTRRSGCRGHPSGPFPSRRFVPRDQKVPASFG